MAVKPRLPERICHLCALAVLLPLGIASADESNRLGAERFHDDCAVCHGVDARGGGPMAAALKVSPPNLRLLARGNEGTFPEEYVRRAIDGREFPPSAHGSLEMPAWGYAYKRALAGRGEEQVQKRLDALIDWLKSVQDD